MGFLRKARAVKGVRDSMAARAEYERTGDVAALERAVASARTGVESCPAGDPLRTIAASTLGYALRLRYERFHDDADLRAAIGLAEEAATASTPADPNWSVFQNELGTVLLGAFERFGEEAYLRRSVAAGEESVATGVPGSVELGGRTVNLANAHRLAYDRFGDPDDLDRAVSTGMAAVALTPPDARSFPLVLTVPGIALQQRFTLKGLREDLDEALDLGDRAVRATPAGDPELVGRLSNLALAFVKRHQHGGAADDLDRAVDLSARAVDETPADHPDRALYLSTLSIVLRRRAERTGSLDDLGRAVDAGEQVVDVTPIDHPQSLWWRANLVNAYVTKYEYLREPADLDRAVALGEQTLASSPGDHRQLAQWTSNLAIAHLARYRHTNDTADLDRAVSLGERALVDTPSGSSNRMVVTVQLYEAYQARFDLTGHGVPPDRLGEVVEWIGVATPAFPWHQVRIGYVVGRLANAMGEHAIATRALDAAVRALPAVAPRELARGDQEFALGGHSGLVSEALTAHLAVGDPVGAITVAELGRGVLVSAALDLRSELSGLADRDPVLAHRVEWARERVSRQEELEPADRERRWRDYRDLVDEVRALPGFARFQLPPSLDEVRPTDDGVVVVVTAGRGRGDAIVVGSEGEPVSVRLPDLRHDRALSWADQVGEVTAASGTLAGGLRARRVVGDVLARLWDEVVGPVVDLLPADRLSRVWWLPVGPLGLLPLHAAGHRGEPGALDRVVSSYTSTLRALDHARGRPAAPTRRQLTVAMASTPGLPPLHATAAEAASLAEQSPGGIALSDGTATATTVLDALETSTWAHFACHASTDPASPSRGGLDLHDGRLAIGRINDLRLAHGELAYLSACSTARTGWRHADESIHLASAFQLAGYRHVVASLWPLADGVASRVASAFYRALPPEPSNGDFATALHGVVGGLREEYGGRPDLWASIIHSGP